MIVTDEFLYQYEAAMTKTEKIRLCYGIFLSALTVLVGLMFIIEAAQLYYSRLGSGEDIYTREIVGQRLALMMIPVGIWIAAIVAGFVLSVIYPVRSCARKRDPRDTVALLSRRIPKSGDGEERAQYRRYQIYRTVGYCVSAAICVAAAIASAVYLLNTAHFPAKDVTAEVLQMLKNVLPWIGAAFVGCIAAALWDRGCAKKQLPLVKTILRQGGAAAPESQSIVFPKNAVWAIRLSLLVVGIVFVGLGIWNGGAHDVLIKAINICTECIGLG